MIPMLSSLSKPAYLFQPRVAVRQLVRVLLQGSPPPMAEVELPWGVSISVQPREAIGLCLYKSRIYDLIVTETVSRLVAEADACVDCGANIGYITSLMAVRAGRRGVVYAFEAHPGIFQQLTQNAARWNGISDIHLNCCGVSDSNHGALLWLPDEFAVNRGVASLEAQRFDGALPSEGIKVETRRLDDVLPASTKIGVMKVDVEGHEAAVFSGMAGLLGAKMVRDIVFEEWKPYPARTHELLRAHGFTVFSLGQRLTGPLLLAADAETGRDSYDPVNYLATLDPKRAMDLFRPRGWTCLARPARRPNGSD
jgi:FkbM family methyltransferase